jgi:tetratricopeptide (TPR) repeat protein
MKKLFSVLALLGIIGFSNSVNAQESLLETGKAFLRSGDFDNAVLVLNRAVQEDPENLEIHQNLTMAYYKKRDFTKALEEVKYMLEREDADVITFQIAGNVYKEVEDLKGADKMYKKALKKFPKSGPLYSEYGEFLWAKKDNDAIEYWENGIKEDPSYSGNYYNAAVYYFYTKDKVWSLIYGEIFVNMESLSERGTAMKTLLLNAYKEKLFSTANLLEGEEKNKNLFARAYLETMNKQSAIASRGITTETLTMIRTRFVLDWFKDNSMKFPHRLFEYHQQLIREGMFDAYNQWLFGTVENLPAYDNWTKTHTEQYNKFTNFQKGRIFKMPTGHYYQQL